jgi:hypothetical protein
VPLVTLDTETFGEVVQEADCVILGVDGMGEQEDVRIVLDGVIHAEHLCFHDRADGAA